MTYQISRQIKSVFFVAQSTRSLHELEIIKFTQKKLLGTNIRFDQ